VDGRTDLDNVIAYAIFNFSFDTNPQEVILLNISNITEENLEKRDKFGFLIEQSILQGGHSVLLPLVKMVTLFVSW
jgi:hypothetical protein